MSPIKELRYVHSLIVMIATIRKLKLLLDNVENNADYLKKLIVEDNQIEMFE
jgi:hypothetical protein